MKRLLLFIFILGGGFLLSLHADESGNTWLVSDSLVIESSNDSVRIVDGDGVPVTANSKEVAQSAKTVTVKKPYELNSTKSVLFSIIPGGGQIYNRQYWKLPIIVGITTVCYYAVSWNNANLQEYSTAFREIKSDKPMEYETWKDFLPYNADPESYINNTSFHDQLKRGRDYFRRYRDMSIIISAAFYALIMIDAYVDAELHNFDISPNLSLSYAPAIIPNPTPQRNSNGYGVYLALTF